MVKRFDRDILVIALIISTILFLSGVALGWFLNETKISILEQSLIDTKGDIENFQLQILLLDNLGKNITCPFLEEQIKNIDKKAYELGSKLESLSKENKENEDYVKAKSEYSRILVTYWSLAGKMKNLCGHENFVSVLYFFSKNCISCDDQSFVLTYLKDKLNEKFLVFTLDADFNEPVINILKKYYNIEKYPTIILENNKLENLQDKKDILNITCKYIESEICS
jgi:thiol-disulfide isomerase/thioredoxin